MEENEKKKLLENFQVSGMTQAAFAVENGINPKTLARWIYVRPGATDLRKGVSVLLAIIENDMHLNALDESVFLFCNKSHKLLKLIFWDKTGF